MYTQQLGAEFHRAAVEEMCRVANEVRIFPLLALGVQHSPFADMLVPELAGSGFDVSIVNVPYEFQRGGNEMMRIRQNASKG